MLAHTYIHMHHIRSLDCLDLRYRYSVNEIIYMVTTPGMQNLIWTNTTPFQLEQEPR